MAHFFCSYLINNASSVLLGFYEYLDWVHRCGRCSACDMKGWERKQTEHKNHSYCMCSELWILFVDAVEFSFVFWRTIFVLCQLLNLMIHYSFTGTSAIVSLLFFTICLSMLLLPFSLSCGTHCPDHRFPCRSNIYHL